jgi:hypothetical protein
MSTESHYIVRRGKVFLRTENDGWSFMKRGAEPQDEEVTLEYVREHPQYAQDFEHVAAELGSLVGNYLVTAPRDLQRKPGGGWIVFNRVSAEKRDSQLLCCARVGTELQGEGSFLALRVCSRSFWRDFSKRALGD